MLLYNCGTWALTVTDIDRLDSFHRQQLRQLLGVHYPHWISNAALYARCNAELLRFCLARARWRLFGHIMRHPASIPAYRAMVMYFSPAAAQCTSYLKCSTMTSKPRRLVTNSSLCPISKPSAPSPKTATAERNWPSRYLPPDTSLKTTYAKSSCTLLTA